MSGRTQNNILNGFATGFQLMEGHHARKTNDQRYQDQQQRENRRDEMREEEFAYQKETRAKDDGLKQIAAFYEMDASGLDPEVTPELEQAFELHPHLRLNNVYDPQTSESVSVAKQVALGDLDPNDPKALTAFNQFFAAEIDQGDAEGLQEGQVARKRISRVMPGTGGESLVFELDVDVLDEAGEVVRSYKAPMTTGHGAADDEVLQVPIETLTQSAVAMQRLQETIPAEVKERRMNYLRKIGLLSPGAEQWEQIQGPGGSLLQRNTATGETKQIVGRESRVGLGGSNSRGAAQKDLEYLREQFPEASADELIQKYREIKGFDRKAGGDVSLQYTRVASAMNDVAEELSMLPDDDPRRGQLEQQMQDYERILAQLQGQEEEQAEEEPEQPGLRQLGSGRAPVSDPAIQGQSMRLGIQQPQRAAPAAAPAPGNRDDELRSLW